MTLSRRRYLVALGGASAVGLAGCGGGDADRTTYDAGTVSAPEEVSDYLSDASNFEGEVIDLTGRDEVEVAVGTRGNDGYNAYSPPAIQISTGTTVVWEWTGQGAPHNVKAEGDAFDSGAATASSDESYSHTFEQSGTYRYFCTPHKTQGMKGAVVVE